MRQSGFITDWIEEAEAKASERALQQGLQRGAQQGKQSLLIQQLKAKFGKLPSEVVEQIRGMAREEELDRLGIRILTAKSLEEMGLDGGQSGV